MVSLRFSLLGALAILLGVADSIAVEPDSEYCISTSAHLGPIHLRPDPLMEKLRRLTAAQLASLSKTTSVLGEPNEESVASERYEAVWSDGEMELEVSIDCKAPYNGSRHNHNYVVRHYRIELVAIHDLVQSCRVSTSTQFSKEPWPLPNYGASHLDKEFACSRVTQEIGLR